MASVMHSWKTGGKNRLGSGAGEENAQSTDDPTAESSTWGWGREGNIAAETPKLSGVGRMESTGFRHERSCTRQHGQGGRSFYEVVIMFFLLSVILL